MDTLGALALGTESPSSSVLLRKPYKRSASLISRPMWRNILCQSAFQLTLLFVLLFKGAEMFGVRPLSEANCFTYFVENGSQKWDSSTLLKSSTGDISCSSFQDFCPDKSDNCFNQKHFSTIEKSYFQFSKLSDFSDECLTCYKKDYVHGSIIFNAFIFCQVREKLKTIRFYLSFLSIIYSFYFLLFIFFIYLLFHFSEASPLFSFFFSNQFLITTIIFPIVTQSFIYPSI